MTEKKEKFPSTFTLDNFSSTTKLASHEVKVPVGSVETINEKDDLYNPFDHRPAEHQNSSLGSLVHMVKSSLGTGILAMPNAFKNGGLLFGFIGTIVVGLLCTHCVHVLVKASHEMSRRSKKPCLGFSETAGAVFKYGPAKLQPWAPTAQVVVDVALVVTYFMGGSVYIVFISESIKEVVDDNFPELKWSIHVYMALILVPIILSCQFRELRYLVPFSFLANMFMVVSFAITLYYMFSDIKETDRKLIGEIDGLPLFFSTVIFAMEGIGVVMPVENSMKKPQQFLGCPGVLNIAMAIVVALYSIIGFFGYMKYGEGTAASITFNLPNDILAEVAKIFIALAVFFTYSLQFHVPMDITWRKICVNRIPVKYHNIGQVGIRTLIILGSLGIAALVPDLEPIIALVGAVCLSSLGVLIPAIVETVLCWDGRLGFLKWRLAKNILLGCFSIFALVSGSFFAVKDIIGS